MNKTKGFIALLGAALVFSLLGFIIRSLDKYFSSSVQVSLRALATSAILVCWLLYKRAGFTVEKYNKYAMLLYLLVGPIGTIFFTESVLQIKAANSVFYLYLSSFALSFAISSLIFKEGLGVKKLTSLVSQSWD